MYAFINVIIVHQTLFSMVFHLIFKFFFLLIYILVNVVKINLHKFFDKNMLYMFCNYSISTFFVWCFN